MPDDFTTLPDRAHVLTEQRNPRTTAIDSASVAECVAMLNAEDATVAGAVRAAAPAIVAFIEALEERWNRGGRLIYLGAGTSGRLGVLDASECPPTFQTPPERVVGVIAGGDSALRRSSEGAEDDPNGALPALTELAVSANDALLGIAAGGTTPYVLGGMAEARRRGALTGLLTCAPPRAPIECDHLIVIETGPEAITGSTRMKAGAATKMALNMVTTTLMIRTGKVYENLMVDLRATNAKLRDRAVRIVAEVTGLDRQSAAEALRAADGSVKGAIVMTERRCDRAEAEALLDRAGGRLREALRSTAAEKPS